MFDDPLVRALAAGLLLVGSMGLERQALRWRNATYFAVGLPLPLQLVPIAGVPEGQGQTSLVHWETTEAQTVRFWAEPGERNAPMGLHGTVRFSRQGDRVLMHFTWAPPWAMLLAPFWLVGIGLYIGEPQVTSPIATVMLGGILLLYWRFAQQAAAELRWAFVRNLEGE